MNVCGGLRFDEMNITMYCDQFKSKQIDIFAGTYNLGLSNVTAYEYQRNIVRLTNLSEEPATESPFSQ